MIDDSIGYVSELRLTTSIVIKEYDDDDDDDDICQISCAYSPISSVITL